MASLDQMEGDAVEVAILAALLAVAYIAYEAYTTGGNFATAAAALVRKIWNAVDGAFNSAVTSLSNVNQPLAGYGNAAQVQTGTAIGNAGNGTLTDSAGNFAGYADAASGLAALSGVIGG